MTWDRFKAPFENLKVIGSNLFLKPSSKFKKHGDERI